MSSCASNRDCVSSAQKCCYYRSTQSHACCNIHEEEGNLFNFIWYSLGALFLVVVCVGVIIGKCIKRKLKKVGCGNGINGNKPENRRNRNCNQLRNTSSSQSDQEGSSHISPPEYSTPLPPPAYTESNSLQIISSQNSLPYPLDPTVSSETNSSHPSNSEQCPQIGFQAPPTISRPIGFIPPMTNNEPSFNRGQMSGHDINMPPVEEMPPSYEQSSYGNSYGQFSNYGFVSN